MKLSKISLLQLSRAEMERREQNMLRGGSDNFCLCGCTTNCPCKSAGPQESSDDPYYGGTNSDSVFSSASSGPSFATFEKAEVTGDYYCYEYYL